MKKITTTLLLCMAILFSFSQSVTLNLKAYIEGPYYNGQMTPFLNVLGYLPTDQPYNTSPWNYPGNESVTSFPSSNIVDWVLVDVLEPHTVGNQTKFEVVGRKAGFLFKTGSIKDIDGISNLIVQSDIGSGFYVRIHHRNHLSVISAVPLVESGGVFTYDFTFPADQAMGGSLSQKQLSSVIWGMIAADANASGQIDNRDKNDVWLPQQNLTGYYEGDFNMDTQVDNDDKVVKWEPNAGKSSYPVKDTVITPVTWNCGDTIIDSRDGQTYNTVLIGDQCWMAENLNIGTMIPGANDMSNDAIIEKYCFDNNSTNCDTYGGLYQWDEMMEYTIQDVTQGICPIGWHLPTDEQWTIQTNYLGGVGVASGKMKSTGTLETGTGLWFAPNLNATNSSGFSALPGGYRSGGSFFMLGSWANFWSSSQNLSNSAWARYLGYNEVNVLIVNGGKEAGFSVRCLKDTPPPTWSCGDPLNDTRDGQSYNTVLIGEQCWMAENLNIGTMIPGANEMTNNSIIEKYCYDNNTANCDTYGGLYQWNEMMEYNDLERNQGICPTGWHVPSDAEWNILEGSVDSQYGVGNPEWYLEEEWRGFDVSKNLKNTSGWNNGGNGIDTYGFGALPSGDRNPWGVFGGISIACFWWTSTKDINVDPWFRYLDGSSDMSYRGYLYLGQLTGRSVRCIKDTPPTWSCGDHLNDIRDGQSYNTVQIGDQCWMAENLNVGTMVQGTTAMTDNSNIEKYCYDNNTANCDTYGGLYQWNEMMEYSTQEGTQGICPIGWHVPKDTEYCTLTQFIDPTVVCSVNAYSGTDIGTKMKSTTGWNEEGNGTNTSGFSAIPAGGRNDMTDFFGLGGYTFFWSSTVGVDNTSWDRKLFYNYSYIWRNYDDNYTGFSVRCLKDNTPPTWSCGEPLNDIRDNQTYNTVQIGDQCWMSENLKIGTMTNGDYDMANNGVIEKYCYGNNNSNCESYGGLYQWNEMMEYTEQEGVQGICPIGWHIPTDNEWCALTQFIDPTVNCNTTGSSGTDVGNKMKSTTGWNSGGNGTNASGFNALPGGFRTFGTSFYDLGNHAYFWSSSVFESLNAWNRGLKYSNDYVYRDFTIKTLGFSVRCIRN